MHEEDCATLVAQALATSRQGDATQAIALLRMAVTRPDADGTPWLLLAAELASQGQMADAENAYAETVIRCPELAVARFQLGLLQISSGRVAMAALTWQPLLARSDDDALRCYAEGYLALAGDQFRHALERFEQGVSLPQDNLPLQDDVRKTMATVEAFMREQQDSPDTPSEAETSKHVLLSNYAAGSLRH